jgi:hypothetical protein
VGSSPCEIDLDSRGMAARGPAAKLAAFQHCLHANQRLCEVSGYSDAVLREKSGLVFFCVQERLLCKGIASSLIMAWES